MNTLTKCLFATSVVLALAAPAAAAIEPRSILKTFFETGDIPTEDQFENLIDSFINLTDDGLTIYGIGTRPGGSAARLLTGETIGGSGSISFDWTQVDGPLAVIPPMAPEFGGEFGFLALQLRDTLGAEYLGYFQIRMDDPLSIDPPGIHVDYFGFDSSGSESLVIEALPEPGALALALIAAPFLGAVVAKRRKLLRRS